VTASSESQCRELTWAEPIEDGAPFILRAEGCEVGFLRLDRRPPGHALGEIRGRRWILERTSLLRLRVTVREEGSTEPVAVFRQGWTGGGIVTFADGTEYCWNPAHIWSTTWCFRRSGQKASLCVSQQTPQKTGARVRLCVEAGECQEMPVLLLLGLYLRRLALERLGEMITGVE
jgi:hypothetical protein